MQDRAIDSDIAYTEAKRGGCRSVELAQKTIKL